MSTPGSAPAWGPVTPGEGPRFRCGPLQLWLTAGENLVRYAFHVQEGEAPQSPAFWKQLWMENGTVALSVEPRFPDRPVVLRPEAVTTLLPRQKIQFYVGIPVCAALTATGDVTIAREPVHRLSNSWFGKPTEGELCYALRTRARREVQGGEFDRVLCPVRIRNQSNEVLTFERLCLRVEHLNLYRSADGTLWANESGVTYRGSREWSRLTYTRNPPALAQKPELLHAATVPARGGLSFRAFAMEGGWW